MNRKTKECARCKKPRLIKSYGLCENCYNIMYWKWDAKRPTRTFGQFMTRSTSKGKITSQDAQEPTGRVKKRKTGVQRARDRADTWFSRFIRLKYSHLVYEINGEARYCYCYTCGNPKHIKAIDCGHYINREHMQVRYNSNNARPQCTLCNKYKSGRHTKFEQLLIDEIGQQPVDNLKKLALIKIPMSELELREISDYYRIKVKEIQNSFNIKIW